MAQPTLRALDQLCDGLPFHPNEIDQVNQAFQRWQARGFEGVEYTVDVWTYCFVRRYFLVKFMKEDTYAASDLDALVDEAFRKVERARQGVNDPMRYAHWVSVVCKNTFRNYLRARRRRFLVFDEEDGAVLVEAATWHADSAIVRSAVEGAIDRLPVYLREVAFLRFVEECSYQEIAQRTGRSAASVRAYISKVLARLRKDTRLLRLLDTPLR